MAAAPLSEPVRRELAVLLDGLLGAGARVRCGLGWYGLICDLLLALAPERHRARASFSIAAVSADPVSGRMRVEASGALTPEARALIARAEMLSGQRCELCGAVGARVPLPGGGGLVACSRHPAGGDLVGEIGRRAHRAERTPRTPRALRDRHRTLSRKYLR
jgi:hypothetical protein